MKPTDNLERRRLTTVSLAFLLFASVLSVRLLQKQVIEHPTYTALAHAQQYSETTVTGKRGQILVKDGPGKTTYPIATNQTVYDANVVPSQIADKRKTADELGPILEIDPEILYGQINNSKQYIPPIKSQLSYDDAQKIAGLKLPGVFTTPEETRFYPEDTLAADVLGFVNVDGKGQYGIEGYFDDLLAGSNGLHTTAQDSSGAAVALGGSSYVPPKDGSNIVLTIDRNVQYKVEQSLDAAIQKFSAAGGSAIVMDSKTGAIIAMASRPGYDPNRYSAYDVGSYTNQAISSTYEPGSTFKTLVMAAALDAGAVTPNTVCNCGASAHVGDRDIFNAEKKPFGKETMTQVIQNSDNVGMIFTEQHLGNAKTYDYIKRFGIGTPTGVELDNEATPNLAAFDTLNDVDFATMSFGQGISVSPIELITAVNAFANGGWLIQPHIVDQIQHPDGRVETTPTTKVRQVVGATAASEVTGMMVRVVDAGGGHAAGVPGYVVAGKTGTAQIPQAGGYDPNATIGSFVGFAPVDNPRFTMLVKVDRPQGLPFAEESAAPAWGDIAKFLLQYYNVPPSK